MSNFKDKGNKDRKFLNFVKTKRCLLCNRTGSDPHHLKLKGHTRRFIDLGNVVPLCRNCHRYVHYNPLCEKEHYLFFRKRASELKKEYEGEL